MQADSTAESTWRAHTVRPCVRPQAELCRSPTRCRSEAWRSRSELQTATRSPSSTSGRSASCAVRSCPKAIPSGRSARAARPSTRRPTCISGSVRPAILGATSIRSASCRPGNRRRPRQRTPALRLHPCPRPRPRRPPTPRRPKQAPTRVRTKASPFPHPPPGLHRASLRRCRPRTRLRPLSRRSLSLPCRSISRPQSPRRPRRPRLKRLNQQLRRSRKQMVRRNRSDQPPERLRRRRRGRPRHRRPLPLLPLR
jgi:hypothetical protein